MRSLIEALVDDLGDPARSQVKLRTGAVAERIERRRSGYRVIIRGGAPVDGDALILAVPAHVAAGLLAELNPLAAAELRSIGYASVATACFVWPPGAVDLPPDTSGLLVPSHQRRTLAGATWFSQKWPLLGPSDGRIVVKAFAGRSAGDDEPHPDDDRLLAALLDDLGAAVAVRARPLVAHLIRWPGALPLYAVGHLDRVDRIETALGTTPGIQLAGAAYRGSGISDSVKSAQIAAERVAHAVALP
jgi:oxygen-dependent protoporphyrinogen oxidase